MDFTEHNAEARRVWQAYRQGKPERVPMALSVEQRWWVLDPELNPSGITWHDYLNDPETMFQVCLQYKYALAHRIAQDVEMGVPAGAWEITPHFANIVDEAWLGSELVEIEGQTTTTRPVKAPDQRYRHSVAVHQAGFRYQQSGLAGKLHDQHLAFGHRTFVLHAGKLADGQSAIIIDHRAFGPHAAKRCAASTQIGKISGRFTLGLDSASCAQQLFQFDERRSRAATGFCRPTKYPCLVLKTQGADTARIVYREQEIDCLELNRLRFLTRPAGCLAALGVVAQDHPPGPAIGLGVSKCPMKDRTVWDFAMKLRTCNEWKRRLKSKSVR